VAAIAGDQTRMDTFVGAFTDSAPLSGGLSS
jgi:hypothetical protein